HSSIPLSKSSKAISTFLQSLNFIPDFRCFLKLFLLNCFLHLYSHFGNLIIRVRFSRRCKGGCWVPILILFHMSGMPMYVRDERPHKGGERFITFRATQTAVLPESRELITAMGAL